MSNVHVRNILGTGPFALPTSGPMLDAANAQWRAILSSITALEFASAYAMVVNTQNASIQELVFIIEAWVYQHDICKPESTVEQLRQAIRGVLSLSPNVISFGNIDITMLRQGAFHEQAPRIHRVDRNTGTVYFIDSIPPGAQIEVYKFTKHGPSADHGGTRPEPPRLGHRFRPDRLLPTGATSWQVPSSLYFSATGKRQQFRFAYRWPEAADTPAPAPGIRGPLCPLGIVTATANERLLYGSTIFLFAAPRSPKGSER